MGSVPLRQFIFRWLLRYAKPTKRSTGEERRLVVKEPQLPWTLLKNQSGPLFCSGSGCKFSKRPDPDLDPTTLAKFMKEIFGADSFFLLFMASGVVFKPSP
jgi:hypothetical protein